uniref:Formamidopyrimidine-DNA glycosylase n=1 Tax=Crypthecodinium cohnii TaxID=2866 RepID=A0A516AGK0_CRYCO|nr:formamidopyrimidine-DNA glycosylase [Crypthecodinium cohnii]
MPELPEVEAMRKQVERQLRGATITSVDARESGGGPRTGKFDSIVIGERVKEQTFVKTLQNRRITAVKRIGKQIWLELSGDGAHLLFHCGMTGCLSVEGAKRLKFQYFGKGKEWPPKFTKLQLVCKKKGAPGNKSKRLVFFDPRRLGRILLREQPRSEPPICHLAPDPLVELPRLDVFCEVLSKSNMPVKAVLLDQTKLVAGVGNWVADEVLHAARIHPAAIAKTLSKAQVASLRRSISSIVRAAVKVDADAERFPKKWLFHKRWQAGSQRRDVQLPGHGGTLVFRTVAGRTTALVPSRQKMGLLASSGRPRRQQQQQQQNQ